MTEFDQKLYWWICDILEDDPLPDEVKFVYFRIVEDRRGYHLELCGSEIKNCDYFDYRPLEAQFFEHAYPRDEDEFCQQLILSIKNLPIFEDRKIFLLRRGTLKKID